MTARARLIAVDAVVLTARPGVADRMAWFYGEFLGLAPRPGSADLLRFKGERHELHIQLRDDAAADPVETRVHLEIPDLDGAAEQLREWNMPTEWLRGLQFTDRQLVVTDPAGHRVSLRRKWAPTL